ncbi:hypothetical protein ACFWCA_29150 [Streptomyces phaeochromogenes]|uniref:hypothetical protein n=1 Tax=Streptomyces phaeochromogenes TaxID=1923 RepID=UPI00367C394A
MSTIELGLDTFGDIPTDNRGERLSYGGAIRQVVEEAVLADRQQPSRRVIYPLVTPVE